LFFFRFSWGCLTRDIFVARTAIPDCPIVSAKVTKAAVIAGVPLEVVPPDPRKPKDSVVEGMAVLARIIREDIASAQHWCEVGCKSR
jgi:hypothetical protein